MNPPPLFSIEIEWAVVAVSLSLSLSCGWFSLLGYRIVWSNSQTKKAGWILLIAIIDAMISSAALNRSWRSPSRQSSDGNGFNNSDAVSGCIGVLDSDWSRAGYSVAIASRLYGVSMYLTYLSISGYRRLTLRSLSLSLSLSFSLSLSDPWLHAKKTTEQNTIFLWLSSVLSVELINFD